MAGKISSVLTAAYSVLACVIAAFALLASAGGHVDPGVQVDTAKGVVRSVVVGGLGWRAGVREGQTVISVAPADAPGGWRIETISGSHRVAAGAGRSEELLRQSVVLAGAACLAGGASVLLIGRRRRAAQGLAAIGVVLASLPLGLQHDPGTVRLALPLALAMPVGWMVRWALAAPWGVLLGGVSVVFIATWLVLDALQSPALVAAEDLRLGASIASGGVVAAALVRRAAARDRSMSAQRRWLLDAVGVATVFAILGVLVLSGVPYPVLGGVLVLLVVAYPLARKQLADLLDRLLFADLRDRMAIQAAEAERARLARDLHDAPLQELAGVIKRLELSGVQTESEALRGVAQDLRSVAAELHPPVLHDLGLIAAIEQAVEGAVGTEPRAAVRIGGSTGVSRSQRPPEEVELALFRIVLEAINNARQHSQAKHITVSGDVSPVAIDLVVEDDGPGISAERQRSAERAGHFGLHSMRRRAELVGAYFDVTNATPRGTRVQVRWPG